MSKTGHRIRIAGVRRLSVAERELSHLFLAGDPNEIYGKYEDSSYILHISWTWRNSELPLVSAYTFNNSLEWTANLFVKSTIGSTMFSYVSSVVKLNRR